MDTLTFHGQLVVMKCWCGIRFAIPSQLNDTAREQGNYTLSCPLGHKGDYWPGKSGEQRERDQRERAEARVRAMQDQLDASERSRRALRGHLTRIKNRIANGVCPVPGCKRTGLTQTMRHIATKHPQWMHDHANDL